MSNSWTPAELLEIAERILLRCVVCGFALVLLWFALDRLAPDIFGLHAKMFKLATHELDVIHYCGMAFIKGCVLVFFVVPYIAVRGVTNRKAN